MAGIGAFLACLNISIFLLCKGADGKITMLAPKDGPSYAFTFLSDGAEKWIDDSVGEALREQTHVQIHSWIGLKGGELIRNRCRRVGRFQKCCIYASCSVYLLVFAVRRREK